MQPIFTEARRLTHRGYSLVDSLQWLLDTHPKSFDEFDRKAAAGLIAARQKLRDKRGEAVQKVIADKKVRDARLRKRNAKQLEEVADAILRGDVDPESPFPVPSHHSAPGRES